MNKVVTISLNGHAYQLDEAAYDALKAYLDQARIRLEADPGKDEILADLEQAVADKLARRMGSRTVANDADVKETLDEMGPVEPQAESHGERPDGEANPPRNPRRLFRLPEEEVLGGVCAGIAAYLGVDVLVVRLAFVILTLLTGGVWLVIYVILWLFVPAANTERERAQASGAPYDAEDILNRARESAMDISRKGRAWRDAWYANRHEWKRQWRAEKAAWKAQRHADKAAWKAERHAMRAQYRPTFAEELMQVALVALIVWAVYSWIPATQPFFDRVWHMIVTGWHSLFSYAAQ